MADIALTISKSLMDSFPEAKKDTALFIIELSERLPKFIGYHSSNIVK